MSRGSPLAVMNIIVSCTDFKDLFQFLNSTISYVLVQNLIAHLVRVAETYGSAYHSCNNYIFVQLFFLPHSNIS